MQEEMISKKQLLELTGISYGQLYRWKRKGLIPESWFVRKSTFTGQETFFPKSKALTRISKIKNMKDDISLDGLADVFSPAKDEISATSEEAVRCGISSEAVFNLFAQSREIGEPLSFNEILSLYIFNDALSSGSVSLGEGRQLIDVLCTALIRFGEKASELFLFRKLGVFTCFCVSHTVDICFDSDTKQVGRYNIHTLMQEIKLKLV